MNLFDFNASFNSLKHRSPRLDDFTEPPLAVIASSADLEFSCFHSQFLCQFMLPRILTPDFQLYNPCFDKDNWSYFCPVFKTFNWSRFTIAYSLRLMFKKPRFGIRRNNGVCPPSKPKTNFTTTSFLPFDRDQKFYHCSDIPRPTRLRTLREPVAGCNSWSFIIIFSSFCKC